MKTLFAVLELLLAVLLLVCAAVTSPVWLAWLWCQWRKQMRSALEEARS